MDFAGAIGLLIGLLFGSYFLKRVYPHAPGWALRVFFWARHGRKGKKAIFVYSQTAFWKDYVEKEILPRLDSRTLPLDWSRRTEWGLKRPLEAKIYEEWAGGGEFVPTAILMTLIGEIKVIRLWHFDPDSKHKKGRPSKEGLQALWVALEGPPA